jgi:hypothetical protein
MVREPVNNVLPKIHLLVLDPGHQLTNANKTVEGLNLWESLDLDV